MRYPDGQELRVGDIVQFGTDHTGTIVVDVDSRTSIPPHSTEQWAYLGAGIVIDTSFGGLVHYLDESSLKQENISLVRRL
jgi:hypothetical protein